MELDNKDLIKLTDKELGSIYGGCPPGGCHTGNDPRNHVGLSPPVDDGAEPRKG